MGHIGLQRDEMTAVAAPDLLRREGAEDIRVVCIVAAPEGVALAECHHPGVTIYAPAVDRRLSEQNFIVPGPGNFGDPLYGTI